MPVEADKLEVINAALALVGDEEITALADVGEREDLANAIYEIRLEEALGMARWRFASAQVQLALDLTPPIARWDRAYDLPAIEPLGIHAVTVLDCTIPFDRYGTQIYCNAQADDVVILDYLFRAEEADWTGRFKGAFVDRLAADFALPKSGTLHDRLLKRSIDAFLKASSLEAMERTTRKLPVHRFTAARRGWTAGQTYGVGGGGSGSGDPIVATISDGDKGVITVTGGVWFLDDDTVDTDQLIDLSVTIGKMALGTEGDILYYGSGGVPMLLAKGSDAEVLTLAAGLPSWAAAGAVADNAITLAMMAHGTSGDILYYAATGTPTYLGKGTVGQVLEMGASFPQWATPSSTDIFATALLHVREEQTSGTDGGTFTSGAYRTRVLNTVLTNEISGVTLSSNQIVDLPAGDYWLEAKAPANKIELHKLKLVNVTDTADLVIGQSEANKNDSGSAQTLATVRGRFTLAGTKTVELQHRSSQSRNTTGLGLSCGFGEVEVFADVCIWKVG